METVLTEKQQILEKLDAEIRRYDGQCKRGLNATRELDALQEFRLKAFGSKLELPKSDKYEGCQNIRF